MWGIGNNKTISTTNIFFHCEHKSMTKILVIRQNFGHSFAKILVIHSPKFWSEITKKLARLRDDQNFGLSLEYRT